LWYAFIVKKELSTTHTTKHSIKDGSTTMDEIKTWSSLRIKKQLMKEAMD
jgi:hypothetical protein